MKFKIIHFYGFFLGILIFLLSVFISNNHLFISKAYTKIKSLCDKDHIYEWNTKHDLCYVIFSESNFEKIDFIKKSNKFNNSEIPLIKIYINNARLQKLRNVALDALRTTKIIDKPYKWVNGKVIFDNEEDQKKANEFIKSQFSKIN